MRDTKYLLAGGLVVLCAGAACGDLSSADSHAGPLRFTGERIEMPLLVEGGHAFVQGDPGDGISRRFIVDTGSPVNVIDREIAEKMGLQKKGEMEVMSGGIVPVLADIVTVAHARFGAVEVVDADFLVLGLAEMSGGLLHGVLGMQLFADVLLTIDPAQERIELVRASLRPGGDHTYAYDKSAQQLRIDVDFAGRSYPMNIDTGAPGSFTLPRSASEDLPLLGALSDGGVARLVDGERSIRLGTLDGDVQFAGKAYPNPQISFMHPSPPHGNIGNGVLQDLALSIDQRQGLLDIRPSAAGRPAQTKDTPRRLGIRMRILPGEGLSAVASVDPGSVSEQAGLRAGDVLLELNGQPFADYDMSALRKLFGGKEALHFIVERESERHEIGID